MKKFNELIIIIIVIAIGFSYTANAQISINTDGTAPNASAMLEVKSTDRGLLPPRVANVNDISNPVAGLLVFDQSVNCMRYYNGTNWSACIGKPFICGDPFEDTRNRRSYRTVQIGTQCWMAENLNIGDRINGNISQTANNTIEKYCYDNLESNCDTLGGLYQWDEMMQYATIESKQGVCPNGWHLPSHVEWTTLTDYVEGQVDYICNSSSIRIAKSLADTTQWTTSSVLCAVGNNLSANNGTGFTVMPAGWLSLTNSFGYRSNYTFLWSSTHSGNLAWRRTLTFDEATMYQAQTNRSYGFSVRCVLDSD